MIPFVSIT